MDNDEHDSSRIHFIGRTIGIAIVIGAVAASVYAFRLNFVRPRTDDAAIRVEAATRQLLERGVAARTPARER